MAFLLSCRALDSFFPLVALLWLTFSVGCTSTWFRRKCFFVCFFLRNMGLINACWLTFIIVYSCGLMVRESNPKVASSSLGPAGIVGGGWMSSALSTLNTTTEVRPLSKAPNPQLLLGRRSINGCPLLRVCVFKVCVCALLCVCTLDGSNAEHKFRVWVTILGRL